MVESMRLETDFSIVQPAGVKNAKAVSSLYSPLKTRSAVCR